MGAGILIKATAGADTVDEGMLTGCGEDHGALIAADVTDLHTGTNLIAGRCLGDCTIIVGVDARSRNRHHCDLAALGTLEGALAIRHTGGFLGHSAGIILMAVLHRHLFHFGMTASGALELPVPEREDPQVAVAVRTVHSSSPLFMSISLSMFILCVISARPLFRISLNIPLSLSMK